MFCGYYMPAATMINDEDQPAAPELARRITALQRPRPRRSAGPLLEAMAADGIAVGDILADAGFSYRREDTWAGRCATSANS
jgi:hypothetical protein